MPVQSHRETLVDEIATVITEHRGETGAREMAVHVVEAEDPAALLIGITGGATRQLVWTPATWSVTKRPVSSSRRERERPELVTKLRSYVQIENYVVERADELEWVHPRWRWAYADAWTDGSGSDD